MNKMNKNVTPQCKLMQPCTRKVTGPMDRQQ
jgi:hypothetical protein